MKPATIATSRAVQYMGLPKAALPPVIIKSVVFIAISIAIIESNDIDNAVRKAKFQANCSRQCRRIVSKMMEVINPAMVARTICALIVTEGK